MRKRSIKCLTVLLSSLCLITPVTAQVSPESAEKYNSGVELVNKRRFQEALVDFEEAVRLDGKNAQAYRAMGSTYKKIRNYQKSAEAYRMAVTVKPDYAAAYFELGQLYLTFLKEYENAQKSFQKVLEIDPQLADGKSREYLKFAYLQQGTHYLKRRSYKNAVVQYENATQLDPTDATAFYNLGLAYKGARNYRKAEEAYTTATDLNPKYARAFSALGNLYKNTKRNSQAIRAYRKAIANDPKNILAYRNLAQVYLQTKQPAKAVTTLKQALGVATKNTQVLVNLGHAHAQRKQYKSAINSYQRAIRLNGNNPEAHYRLSDAYFATKQYQTAISSAKRATGSRKYAVPAHVIIGDSYEALKQPGWKEKAVFHYKKGLKDRRYKKYCEDKIDRILNPMDDGEGGEDQ